MVNKKDFKAMAESLAKENKRYRIVAEGETFIVHGRNVEDALKRCHIFHPHLVPGTFTIFQDFEVI
jgi:hypothetical protein